MHLCVHVHAPVYPPTPHFLLLLNIFSFFTEFIRKLWQCNPTKFKFIKFIRYSVPDTQTC